MLIKRKKGQIAFLMIFVVAISLSGSALLMMASFSEDLNFRSEEISQLSYQAEFNYRYILAQSKLILSQTAKKCPSCSNKQLKQKFIEISNEKESLFRYESSGNFYGKTRNGNFTIQNNELKMENLFVESAAGENKIKKTFNLILEIPQ